MHLEPYDQRRFVATAYHQVGAPIDRLMVFGGWTTSVNLRKCYIEENYSLHPEVAAFYAWLKTDLPILESHVVDEVNVLASSFSKRAVKRTKKPLASTST